MQYDIEPLPPELWFERIEAIARRQLGGTESCLRHAFHLLQLTPREFRPPEYGKLDEAGYEALLEAGDLEAAAQTLLAAPSLSVSTTSMGGRVKVAVRCSKLDRTIIGEGDSIADAILQAWTECLLMLREVGPTWLRANEL
jgi:hypothetical protein